MTTIVPDTSAPPSELTDLAQWVVWRLERLPSAKKDTKVPYCATGSHRKASSKASATWATFEQARQRFESGGYSGMGFVFAETDDFCGIDLDDCIDLTTGAVAPAAQAIIDSFNSYTEVSPSGTGVKIWIRGKKPAGAKCKRSGRGFKEIEIYDRARYFAFTGRHFDGTPREVRPAQDALDAILRDYGFVSVKPSAATTKPPRFMEPDTGAGLEPRGETAGGRTADGEARCWSYLERCPDAVSGDSGHDKTLRAACECVRFDLDEAATWRVMERFNAEKCDEKWTQKELAHKIDSAQDKAGHERGIRNNSPRSAVPIPDAPQLEFEGPHELQLTATNARQIGARGRVEVGFDVSIGGQSQSPISVTTSASSIRDSVRDLATWIELATGADSLTRHDRAKVSQFIGNTMKVAPALAEYFKAIRQSVPVARPDGESMQSIIIEHAPRMAGLAFKNLDGSAWSETLARSIDFREFERRIPAPLIRACENAVDYPEDRIGLSAPVGTLRQYLGVAWAEALATLPGEVKADTGPDSEAAKRYAQAMARLFTIRERWRKTYARDGSEQALDSATLAQLAREKIDHQPIERASGWQRIHNAAIDAWFCTTPRLHEGIPTGEPPDAWLAFRIELVNQLPKHSRPDLPNTTGMRELGIIARRYGLTADTDPAAPISLVKERGKQRRVIVLNRRLTDLILWQWEEGHEPVETCCNPDRVTVSFGSQEREGDESPLRGQK